ncbi:MAG: HAMP domain-containing sensor histidine kinase [Cardiobacteriaceae bacterium]|nr:HAMP domain-containing sensor histidine kinase [Cardiobacteriaceae bacterium]
MVNKKEIAIYDQAERVLHIEEERDIYRLQFMGVINLVRMVIALIMLLFVFSLEQIKALWHTPQSPYFFGGIVVFYLLFLGLFYIFSKKESYQSYGWLGLLNSLLDVTFLAVLGSFLASKSSWNIFALLLFYSALLSIIVLRLRDGLIYSGYLTLLLMCSYLYLAKNINVFEYFTEVLFISFGQGLLVYIMVRLSNQAQDSRIEAELNRKYSDYLRRLNDAIINSMGMAMIVINEQGVILTLNKTAYQVFNLRASVPKTLILLSSELALRFGHWNDTKIKSSEALRLGSRRYIVDFTAIANKESGSENLILIQLEDVDDSFSRIRETRLSSLGRLTAGIAHEIRNPLSTVQASAQLLAELSESETVHDLTNKITRNTKRISSIINDILNLFKDDMRNNEKVNVNEFIRYVIDEARQNDELNHIFIKSNLRETEGCIIYFDSGHLRQALDNLMLNSAKHGGRKDLDIRIVTRKGEGRVLYIDVIDNGKGVSIEDEEKIFEPFFSGQSSTGLGLYLVREMCVANQAKVFYMRQPTGACFRIAAEYFVEDR